MENKTFDIDEYIREKIKAYDPGPRPQTGPRPLSRNKYEATLWRALTRKKLATIAEKVGVSHDTIRQWSRQQRFKDAVQGARQEFAGGFVAELQKIYLDKIQEFNTRLGHWLESEGGDPSPNPRITDFKGFSAVPEALQVEILEAAVNLQLSSLENAAEETEMLVVATTALFLDLQTIFFPKDKMRGEIAGKVAQERIGLIESLMSCFLQPVLENKALSVRERNGLWLLSETVARFAKENVTEA